MLQTLEHGKRLVLLLLLASVSVVLIIHVVPRFLPNPYAQQVDQQLLTPAQNHWFGTDQLGRDVAARAYFGLLNTARLILLCVFVTLLLAFPLGFIAAQRRSLETILEGVAGAVYSLPTFIVALIVFVGLRGQDIAMKFALLGIFNWVPIYRSVRDMTKQVQTMPYVTFVRAMGFPERQVYLWHIFPGVLPPVFPVIMLNLVSLLEAEFLLSFLGLSYPDPVPTLGGILRQGIAYLDLPMILVPSTIMAVLIFFLLARFEPAPRAMV